MRPQETMRRGLGHWSGWAFAGSVFAAVALLVTANAIHRPPSVMLVPIEQYSDAVSVAIAEALRPVTRTIANILTLPLTGLNAALTTMPWLAVATFVIVAGYLSSGARVAVLSAIGLSYLLVTGLWPEAMATLATVAIAVPIATSIGFGVGLVAHLWIPARRPIQTFLDLMQTVPTFAYLIPMLILFGIGPVVGMLAAAAYAFAPVAHCTVLGLERLPAEAIEASQIAGSTRRQELLWIRLPAALPTILLGVNQTIMAVLSMAVIASILGGFPDLGWSVYASMKKAQFGQSVTAGLAISVLAILMDRISAGWISSDYRWTWRSGSLVFAGAMALAFIVAWLIPTFATFPSDWIADPSRQLNSMLEILTGDYFWVTSAVKDVAVVHLLLPLSQGALAPLASGTGFDLAVNALFLMGVAMASVVVARRWGHVPAMLFGAFLVIYGFGMVGLPWIAVVAMICGAAYHAGGWRLSFASLAALLFIASTDLWDSAMETLALTLAGVILASALGLFLGIVAAESDRLSALLRPIYDTLQTIPSFVYLIPAIMIFLVGNFTGLVAIAVYSFVPAARFAEHGIRNAPVHIVEAARSFGATRWQILRDIRIPLAMPEIMLGLSQATMMAFAMVVVASLVGAKGLGQDIMIALTWMDAGKGFVSGVSVAILAMITDRIMRGAIVRHRPVD